MENTEPTECQTMIFFDSQKLHFKDKIYKNLPTFSLVSNFETLIFFFFHLNRFSCIDNHIRSNRCSFSAILVTATKVCFILSNFDNNITDGAVLVIRIQFERWEILFVCEKQIIIKMPRFSRNTDTLCKIVNAFFIVI